MADRSGPDGAPTAALHPLYLNLPPQLQEGEVLAGRYRVLRFIARGGVGEVYEAEDLELRERIAIKTLRPHIAGDEKTMERFRRESQLSRRVTHANVCRVFDLVRHRGERSDGTVEHVAFLTMELLAGETLSERVRRAGPLGSTEALPIVKQMAAALAAAHASGVVHRDFKSSNVMLVPSAEGPRAVVTDFGLARGGAPADLEAASLTVSGAVVGTPAYMSPEQLEGKDATAASDVYALGIVLYEMVTGVWPFAGDTPLTIAVRRLNETPPSPRTVVPELDERWDAAIMRCLERRPADRFASVADVPRALEGEPVAPPRRVMESRRRWLVGLPAGAVVAAGLGLLGYRLATRPAPRGSAPPVDLVQVTSSSGLDIYPTFSPDGSALAYSSDRAGPFEIYVKPVGSAAGERRLTADGQHNVQPAWSPDGQRIAYHSTGRGGLWVVPAAGGVPAQLCSFGSRPAWSPDGAWIAFQSDRLVDLSANSGEGATLWLVRADGSQAHPLTLLDRPLGGHGAPAWSPDGARIVFVAQDYRTSGIWSVSRDGRDLVQIVQTQFRSYDPVFGAHGEAVYFSAASANQTYSVSRIDVSAADGRPRGQPVQVANVGLSTIRHLAISRDGTRLAYGALSMRSNLWATAVTADGRPRGAPFALTSETTRNSFPVFSRDGSRIAFIRFRPGANADLWVAEADGNDAVQATNDPAIDYMPSWFPDGERLAFHSDRGGRWRIWSVRLDNGETQPLADLGPDADFPRLSPDGTRLLFQKKVGTVSNLWVAPLPQGQARQLSSDPEMMAFGSWSPDGTVLAAELKRGDEYHVAAIPSEGGPATQLTFGPSQNWPHSFSPDGDKIAFAALREGSWNLWWVSRRSRRERQLTTHSRLNAYVRYPAWSPRGDRIVYELAETTGNVWMAQGLRPN